MVILNEIIGRRSLKIESMELLKAINSLPDGERFVVEEMKMSLYLDVFNGSKKFVIAAVSLILAMDEDFWLTIIKLLNNYVTTKVDWKHFFGCISSCEGVNCNAEIFTKIILENLNDSAVAQRSAVLLVEYTKHLNDEEKRQTVLEGFDVLLLALVQHEKTFVITLDVLNVIDFKTTSDFYKQEPRKLVSLIDGLIQSYDAFESPVALHNVVINLKMITKLSPEYVTKKVRGIFQSYYHKLLSAYTEFQSLCEQFKQPLTKLSILLENRSWNILPMATLEVIVPIANTLFEDKDVELHSLMVRFYTNVLKQVWTRLILMKPIPFSNEFLKKNVEGFFVAIAETLEDSKLNTGQSSHYLCSLMDLAVMFQPAMYLRYRHSAFQTLVLPMQKKDVQLVARLVRESVFQCEKNADIHSRELILLSWIAFCRNYIDLPSSTASENIIRHYRVDGLFKTQIEMLMSDIIDNEKGKNVFEQIIAFSTLNLSNLDDIAGFRSFIQAIDEYLTRKFNDESSKMKLKTSICAQLLSKLKTHLEVIRHDTKDRLQVLDYASIMIKGMPPAFKQKLAAFIPSDLDAVGLNNLEKTHFESFKSQFIEEESRIDESNVKK